MYVSSYLVTYLFIFYCLVEQEIQFYLNGVCYDQAFLVSWRGTKVLPKVVMKTVRSAIKLILPPEEIEKVSRLVRVAILVYAVQNNITHVVTVVQKVVHFDSDQTLITIDDLMVYDAINQLRINEDFVNIKDTNVSYLMCDFIFLKFHVIITPVIPSLTDTHVGTRIQHVHF